MSEFLSAIHILVYLGHKKDKINSDDLAKNVCVNPVKVRSVLNKFIKKGIVSTSRGKLGGYSLNYNLDDISILDIIETINFKIIHNNWYTGDINSECNISSGIENYIKDLINTLNIEVEKILSKISLKDVEKSILERRKNEKL